MKRKKSVYKTIQISIFLFGSFILTHSALGQFSLDQKVNTNFEELLKPQKFLIIDQEFSLLTYLQPEHSYHPTLGAFCILENKIAKHTQLPVKMRLGSVDYVDKLENKGK